MDAAIESEAEIDDVEAKLNRELRLKQYRNRRSVPGDLNHSKTQTNRSGLCQRNLSPGTLNRVHQHRQDLRLAVPVSTEVRARQPGPDRVPVQVGSLVRQAPIRLDLETLRRAVLPPVLKRMQAGAVRGVPDQVVQGRAGLDVTASLLPLADTHRVALGTEAQSRVARKAMPQKNAAWENARNAGRNPAKFQKGLRPVASRSLPDRRDSNHSAPSRAGQNSVAPSRLGESRLDLNLLALNPGNRNLLLPKAVESVRNHGRNLTLPETPEPTREMEPASPTPPNRRDSNRVLRGPGPLNPAKANLFLAVLATGVLGKQENDPSPGRLPVPAQVTVLRDESHMRPSLRDSSRPDLPAQGSNPQAPGRPKAGRLKADPQSPGRQRELDRG